MKSSTSDLRLAHQKYQSALLDFKPEPQTVCNGRQCAGFSPGYSKLSTDLHLPWTTRTQARTGLSILRQEHDHYDNFEDNPINDDD